MTLDEALDALGLDMDDLERIVMDSVSPTICTSCGEEGPELEPDARNVECEHCHNNTVTAITELMF